jgi:hypothetical protein
MSNEQKRVKRNMEKTILTRIASSTIVSRPFVKTITLSTRFVAFSVDTVTFMTIGTNKALQTNATIFTTKTFWTLSEGEKEKEKDK